MLYRIERLDKVLLAWEDYWYLTNVLNRMLIARGQKPVCSKERAVVNYGKFRSFLLRRASNDNVINVTPWSPPADDTRHGSFLPTVMAPIVC